MRSAMLAGLLLGCAVSLAAQQAAEPASSSADAPMLSVQAKLVMVPVVVRDKHGALVNGLTRDNFALTVDGAAQPVRYFDHDADVPLTVGLLVDTSMSQRSVLDDERSASVSFVQKMLSPERDKAFVVQFAHSVDLLQDVTNSRPKLQAALQLVDGQSSRPDDGADPGNNNDPHSHGGYGGHGHGGGGTTLYDAVFLSADEVIAKQKDRRALILLTDGVDNGSKESLAKAIEAAQRANTIVYAIYYKGEEHGGHGSGFPGGGGSHGGPGGGGHGGPGHGDHDVDGKKILERLCGETGGRVFEVSRKETVEKIYGEIGEELRSQFRLGFTPSVATAAEGYHQLTVELAGDPAKSKDTVQTRDGYYTKADSH